MTRQSRTCIATPDPVRARCRTEQESILFTATSAGRPSARHQWPVAALGRCRFRFLTWQIHRDGPPVADLVVQLRCHYAALSMPYGTLWGAKGT